MVLFGGWIGLEYLKYRWSDILASASFITPYIAKQYNKDTLRVIMIGDSWAAMHREYKCEKEFADMISCKIGKPVVVKTCGRGGAKSKDIYYLMFKETAFYVDPDSNYCTQSLIQDGADYCVVSIGGNDASANLGIDYLCTNCDYVIRMLLSVKEKPVLIEMPQRNDVNAYKNKPFRHKIVDRIRAFITRSDMYSYDKYRSALYNHLIENGLMDSIIYIKKDWWNKDGYLDNRNIYMHDGMHLNKKGYWFLDSCLADRISLHFKANLEE